MSENCEQGCGHDCGQSSEQNEQCSHNCETCGSNCSERHAPMKAQLNEMSSIKKIIGVVSGKGGVGKSLITSLLSVMINRKGFMTAILDADITGPSIPKAFGVKERAQGNELGIFPVMSKEGIEIVSINNLLEDERTPVLWRGPIIAGTVKQFYEQTIWNDVDYMFVDMPPGTGDVPLTVFQMLPVDGIIVAATPQELVSMIVSKSINMARTMNIPILGLVENMSYFQCDKCGEKHEIFGKSHIDDIAKEYGVDTVARVPLDPNLAALCDQGKIESFQGNWLDPIALKICKLQ